MRNIKDIKTIQKFGILCGSLFISIFFLSCEGSEKISLEISTSGCFKTCPVLDAKLYNNIIYYNFIKSNKDKGTYYYRLNNNEISKLDSLVNSLDLKKIKKEYASQIPDVQVYNTRITYKGEVKNVYFFENEAPKKYQNLINYILNFKEKRKIKIDTLLKISTRDKIKIIDVLPPPMPKE
jgi:hypothetical protein